MIAPVFSNLPEPEHQSLLDPSGYGRIAMFGYRSSNVRLAIEALAAVRATLPFAQLWLIGLPGRDSEVGSEWCDAAAQAGLEPALQFTGTLSPQDLIRAINQCDLCIFDDGLGPSSRKTTLAALLASGLPIVAVDGPNTWQDLVWDEAIWLVDAKPSAIAAAVTRLVQNPETARQLGERGHNFYVRHQARRKVVGDISDFIKQLI